MVHGCNADVVLTVLVHKLVEATSGEGAAEGHALLFDWLAILSLQYNRCIQGLLSGAQLHQVMPLRHTKNIFVCGRSRICTRLNLSSVHATLVNCRKYVKSYLLIGQ